MDDAVKMPEKRVIKRYSNRKLYDTTDSRYVTLQQIGEMVRRGDDVQIIDNKTKEDKTEVTLALILSEDLKNKPRSVPLSTLRTLIQERSERMLSTLREGPFGRLIPKGEEGELGVVGVEAGVEQPAGDAAERAGKDAPAPKDSQATRDEERKGRIGGLMQSSRETLDQFQVALDERVRATVPGLSTITTMQRQIETLRKRIEAIEQHLGINPPDEPSSTGLKK